jgi:hypothetical protein
VIRHLEDAPRSLAWLFRAHPPRKDLESFLETRRRLKYALARLHAVNSGGRLAEGWLTGLDFDCLEVGKSGGEMDAGPAVALAGEVGYLEALITPSSKNVLAFCENGKNKSWNPAIHLDVDEVA